VKDEQAQQNGEFALHIHNEELVMIPPMLRTAALTKPRPSRRAGLNGGFGPGASVEVTQPKVCIVRIADIPEQNAPADFCERVRLLKDLLRRALGAAHQHIW
jgi:hypothetical protein